MSGFDEIIHALDNPSTVFNEPVAPPIPEAKKATPPTFLPGDLVRIRETRWPPETGPINEETGLYDRPGFPVIGTRTESSEIREAKRENLIGIARIGDVCTVLASWYHEDDTWYYFLQSMKPRGRGWTRCAFRLEKLSAGQ